MNAPPLWRSMSFERKLLVTFLLLALVPTLALIATQKNRIERMIDFWENPGVEKALLESRDFAAAAMAAENKRAQTDLEPLAQSLAALPPERRNEEEARAITERGAGSLDLVRVTVGESSMGSRGAPLLDYRRAGVPASIVLPGDVSSHTDDRLACAQSWVRAADGMYIVAVGGILLPESYTERIEAIREGTRYYQRLAVYERYTKAKVAAQAGLVLVAAALIAFVVARFLSRSMSRPIQALVAATRRVRQGDLAVRVEPAGADEIGALVRAFNEMIGDLRTSREKLVRAERVATWAEAARRIAHEIKNPLTPITLSLHRMKKRAERLPEEERRAMEELLEPILEEVGNLIALADEFSQFSRLPAPKSEPVDLADLLEKVTALYREGTGLHVDVDVPPGTPAARGDRELLWRAVSNLVKNAAEAMEGNGELRLSAGRAGEGVEIRIADTGPGIDLAARERIFAPYYTTKSGGTGLGLALVERIVHDHGGTISVEANEPKGALFRILLPAAPA